MAMIKKGTLTKIGQRLKGIPVPSSKGIKGRRPEVPDEMWAQIGESAFDATHQVWRHAWTQMRVGYDGWVDKNDPMEAAVDASSAAICREQLADGGVVRVIREYDDATGKAVYSVDVPGGTGRSFEVALTRDDGGGGANEGSATTASSMTYTVKDLDSGETLKTALGGDTDATGMSPLWQRPIGKTAVAHYGRARWKPDGTLQLIVTDEVPVKAQRSCA